MPKNIPGLVHRRYRRPVKMTPIIIPPPPLPVTPPPIEPDSPPVAYTPQPAPSPSLSGQSQMSAPNTQAPPIQNQRAIPGTPVPSMSHAPMRAYQQSPSVPDTPLPDTPPYLEPIITTHDQQPVPQAQQATPTNLAPAKQQGITPPVARVLIKVNGQIVGDVRLNKAELSIGRREGNDVHIAHPGVSRLHAYIRSDRGLWTIEDADSANGMMYRGQRVKHLVLTNGDNVMIAPNVALVYETAP